MASQKNDPLGTAIGIGAVLVALYVGFKVFSGAKKQVPGVGIMGGGAYNPNSNGYQYQQASAPSALTNALNQLMKALGGKGKGGGGGGVSGPSAPSRILSSVQQQAQAITDFSSAANSMANYADLGGYSLNDLPVGYDSSSYDLSGYSIPNVPGPQSFDLSGIYFDPSASDVLASAQSYGGDLMSMDTADYTDLGTIGG